MKAILLLFLLAFTTCEKSIEEIRKCVFDAPYIQNIILSSMRIRNPNLLHKALYEQFSKIHKIFIDCSMDTKTIKEETKLEINPSAPKLPKGF